MFLLYDFILSDIIYVYTVHEPIYGEGHFIRDCWSFLIIILII